MIRFFSLVAVVALAFAGAASAQTAPTAPTATVTIRQAVAVSSPRPMAFQASDEGGVLQLSTEGISADAPAVIQVTGDPNRVYRIRLPQVAGVEGAVLEELQVHSQTSGDITSVGVARTNSEGRDLLTISGRLRSTNDGQATSARPPLLVAIVYE